MSLAQIIDIHAQIILQETNGRLNGEIDRIIEDIILTRQSLELNYEQ